MNSLLSDRTSVWKWIPSKNSWGFIIDGVSVGLFAPDISSLYKFFAYKNFFNKESIVVKQINVSEAKRFILSRGKTWTTCSLAFGIFVRKDVSIHEGQFFEGRLDDLVGCIAYGPPPGKNVASSISELLASSDVYELTRMWIDEFPGDSNLESFCLGQTFKWIRKNRPNIKALITYVDEGQGNLGYVYQATNWLYQGRSSLAILPNYSISLTGPLEGYDWMHSRVVSETYGSHNLDSLKKSIGHTFWQKKENTKHRYIFILSKGRHRSKLIKSLKHPVLKYPSSKTKNLEEISRIDVTKDLNDPGQIDPFFV